MSGESLKQEFNRFKELACMVFGHEWLEYGSSKTEEGHLFKEHIRCDRCKLLYEKIYPDVYFKVKGSNKTERSEQYGYKR